MSVVITGLAEEVQPVEAADLTMCDRLALSAFAALRSRGKARVIWLDTVEPISSVILGAVAFGELLARSPGPRRTSSGRAIA